MARLKQPKELAELNGMTSEHPKRYKSRGSSKTSVKVHAKKPEFRHEETGFAWDSIVPMLENLKLLTPQYIPSLHEMFDVYDTLQDVKDQRLAFIEEWGIKAINKDKELMGMSSKLIAQFNNLNATWIKYCARFGLSPSEANSITLPDVGEDDPLSVVLGD